MTTKRFTPDNTEGYTPEQLTELNSRYERAIIGWRAIMGWGDDEDAKSRLDAMAEAVKRDYDSGPIRRSKLTPETRAAIRTTYLSSIVQRERNGAFDPADARAEAREFVLWISANRSSAGLLYMWHVPEISVDDLNAVMDAVDAEEGGAQ